MEGAEPDAFGAFANCLNDAVLHLAGGFVRERESEDIFAVKPGVRFEQVTNSLGNDASLASAGTGNDEQGTVSVLHGTALLCV